MKKVHSNNTMGEPIYRVKLLKKELMKFPQNGYLVSNCYNSATGNSIFEGRIDSFETRDQLCKNIKTAKAKGRLCNVFKNYNDYNFYMDKISSKTY